MTTQSIHFATHSHGSKAALAPGAKHAAIVKQTQKWVSQTFYGAMLKQMRNSPFKSELFSGGRGGEAFNEMFDQQLADRMGRGTGKKLVNALVRRIEGAPTPHRRRTVFSAKPRRSRLRSVRTQEATLNQVRNDSNCPGTSSFDSRIRNAPAAAHR